MANFFFAKGHKFPKMIKNSKFFCSITSYAPKNTENNFYDHWSHIPEMNSRFLKKKRFYQKPGEVRILAECVKNSKKLKTSLKQ